MINLISDWQEFSTDYLGSSVKMMLMDLETEDYLRVLEATGNISKLADYDQGLQGLRSVIKVSDIFPKCVKDLTVDGKPVEIELLAKKARLSSLAIAILSQLMMISTASGDDEKNSERQLDSTPSEET